MIKITVIIEEKTAEVDREHTAVFDGDELTSPECQAIIWLRGQQRDALDEQV